MASELDSESLSTLWKISFKREASTVEEYVTTSCTKLCPSFLFSKEISINGDFSKKKFPKFSDHLLKKLRKVSLLRENLHFNAETAIFLWPALVAPSGRGAGLGRDWLRADLVVLWRALGRAPVRLAVKAARGRRRGAVARGALGTLGLGRPESRGPLARTWGTDDKGTDSEYPCINSCKISIFISAKVIQCISCISSFIQSQYPGKISLMISSLIS